MDGSIKKYKWIEMLIEIAISPGDKDFISKITVTQLLTDDIYL